MVQTKFSKLAEIFARLEKTASSLAMIDILADFFPKISPEEAKTEIDVWFKPEELVNHKPLYTKYILHEDD